MTAGKGLEPQEFQNLVNSCSCPWGDRPPSHTTTGTHGTVSPSKTEPVSNGSVTLSSPCSYTLLHLQFCPSSARHQAEKRLHPWCGRSRALVSGRWLLPPSQPAPHQPARGLPRLGPYRSPRTSRSRPRFPCLWALTHTNLSPQPRDLRSK